MQEMEISQDILWNIANILFYETNCIPQQKSQLFPTTVICILG